MEFYSTAAQVIPLLFLVLIVEIRFFQTAVRWWQYVIAAGVIFNVFVGETWALLVLQRGEASTGACVSVWSTLGSLGATVTAFAFSFPRRTP